MADSFTSAGRLGADGTEAATKHIGDWVAGFHGAVRGTDLDSHGQVSLRALALGSRSLGTQRMAVLTALPMTERRKANPSGAMGNRPVAGPVGLTDQPAAGPELSAQLWDAEVEPLSQYLDRRLSEARFLYLPNRSRTYRVVKRGLDLLGATALIVVTAPLMLAIALLIRLDSPGPAIFRQQRVTRGGQVFTFYKFRTMWVDARERFPELYDYRQTGPINDVYYKLEDDPRSTGVGRWLRRTTLDELPNLFNVLRGQMTLVGPRPELPELVAHYRPEDLALFFTKAGLTGLAQVAGRSLLTVGERITLDLRYVAQQTLLLDLRILLRTVRAVLMSRGAF